MASIKQIFNLTVIEFKQYYRDFFSFTMALVFPVLAYVLAVEFFIPREVLPYTFPMMVTLIIYVTSFFSISIAIGDAKLKGIIKAYESSPLGLWQYFCAQILDRGSTLVFTICMLFGISYWVYDISIQGNIFEFILALTICTLAIFSLGFFIAAITKTIEATASLASLIFFTSFIFGGYAIPLENLPNFLEQIANILPFQSTYLLISSAFFGDSLFGELQNIIITVLWGTICAILSVYFFRSDSV